MEDSLKDMWSSVAQFVPKLAAFLVILIVGWIIARLIAKAIDKVLERIGFDRAVERGGIRHALQSSRYDASTIVSKIVYYALLLFVLQLAFGVFGRNPISDLIAGVIAFLPKLLVAVIIIVVVAAIAAAVRDIISNALSGVSYGRLLANIASVFILGLGVIAALNQVGIALTVTLPVLIAILGTIGGILVVGVGGGLIRPMQQRWERYLSRAEQESSTIRDRVNERASSATSGERVSSGAFSAPYGGGGRHQSEADAYQPPMQAPPYGAPHPAQNDPYGARSPYPPSPGPYGEPTTRFPGPTEPYGAPRPNDPYRQAPGGTQSPY